MCDMVALARLSGMVMRRDLTIRSRNKVSRQDRLARPHATADNQRQTKLIYAPNSKLLCRNPNSYKSERTDCYHLKVCKFALGP